MHTSRTKPPTCSACEDACEQKLSAVCSDPIDVVAYVDKQDQPFKTIYPTGSMHKHEGACQETIKQCNTFYRNSCDNGYKIEARGSEVSGMARSLGPLALPRHVPVDLSYVSAPLRVLTPWERSIESGVNGLMSVRYPTAQANWQQ